MANVKQGWEQFKDIFEATFGKKNEKEKMDIQLSPIIEYYRWVLLNKIKGSIKVTCPENWDKDYILDTLLLQGKLCITDTPAGILPLSCGVYGLNCFNRATSINIANPVLGSFTKTINEDCIIIYLFDNIRFMNFTPVIDIYARKLATCDSSIDVNLHNTKVAFIFDVNDKKQQEEMKKIYTDITAGVPAVYYHSTNGMALQDRINYFSNNVKQQYIVDEIQKEKRAIINEFLTQIGINNSAEEKKERLLVDEVNSNNDELECNMNYAYDNIKAGIERTHKMFPDTKEFNIEFPFIDKLKESRDLELQVLEKSLEGSDNNVGKNNENQSV